MAGTFSEILHPAVYTPSEISSYSTTLSPFDWNAPRSGSFSTSSTDSEDAMLLDNFGEMFTLRNNAESGLAQRRDARRTILDMDAAHAEHARAWEAHTLVHDIFWEMKDDVHRFGRRRDECEEYQQWWPDHIAFGEINFGESSGSLMATPAVSPRSQPKLTSRISPPRSKAGGSKHQVGRPADATPPVGPYYGPGTAQIRTPKFKAGASYRQGGLPQVNAPEGRFWEPKDLDDLRPFDVEAQQGQRYDQQPEASMTLSGAVSSLFGIIGSTIENMLD